MKILKAHYPELVPPKWDEIAENIQNMYVKKLFRNTKNYVKNFEHFVVVSCSYRLQLFSCWSICHLN